MSLQLQKVMAAVGTPKPPPSAWTRRFSEKLVCSEELFTFDDVLLVPQESEIRHRDEVSLKHGQLGLEVPIISANMDRISGGAALLAMQKCGGLGILHRFLTVEQLKQEIADFYFANGAELDENKNLPPKQVGHPAYEKLAVSVGVNSSREFLNLCINYARIICVDVAHAHSTHAAEVCKFIAARSPLTIIIAGNVATPEGVAFLSKAGADIVKLGVGPGSFCSTREVTGHGIPQLSAIAACAEAARDNHVELIADGGLRKSGDICKAIGAGADYVMIGNLLAGTVETPGDVITTPDGRKFKEYRGMASLNAQLDMGREKSKIVPEGVSCLKPLVGPMSDVIAQLSGGLRSALSYSGARTISEFQRKAKFVRVTSNVTVENSPHGLLESPL